MLKRKRAAGGQPKALAIIRGVRAVAARLNYADKLLGIFAVGCISVLGLVFYSKELQTLAQSLGYLYVLIKLGLGSKWGIEVDYYAANVVAMFFGSEIVQSYHPSVSFHDASSCCSPVVRLLVN